MDVSNVNMHQLPPSLAAQLTECLSECFEQAVPVHTDDGHSILNGMVTMQRMQKIDETNKQ